MNLVQKSAVAGAFAAAAMAVAAQAQAADVVTFAQYFEQKGVGADMRWVASGKNGELMTISSPTAKKLGATKVVFSFLGDAFGGIKALFTLDAKETNTPVSIAGTTFDQSNLTGSFDFVSTQAFTFDGTSYAAGTDLLKATFFNKSDLFGKKGGTSGGFSGSTGSGSTINYTSGVAGALPGVASDFSFTLTQVAPKFGYTAGKALNSFTASSTGSFSEAVPEPAVWGLMLTGFGMLGLVARRQRRTGALAA